MIEVLVIHRAFETSPVHVATVTVDEDVCDEAACDEAYVATNNIEDSWSIATNADGKHNKDYSNKTTVVAPLSTKHNSNIVLGHRSTSMGDAMVVCKDGAIALYECTAIGWKRI